MTDAELLALCVWDEASNQIYEGQAAVSRVVHNRMALKYQSDGTISGTVLRPGQFSGFFFEMVGGAYERVCSTVEEAQARAETLLVRAKAQPHAWATAQDAAADGAPGSGFAGGPQWTALAAEPRAVLYVNLEIVQPYWAKLAAFVAKIGAHSFYRD